MKTPEVNNVLSLLSYIESLGIVEKNEKLGEMVSNLEKCVLMPNQMMWLTHYQPFEFVFKKNITRVLGYDELEFTPDFSLDIIHPADKEFMITSIHEALEWHRKNQSEKERFVTIYEYRVINKQNEIVKLQRYAYPVYQCKKGVILTSLSVVNDVSFIKKDNQPKAVIYNPRTRENLWFASLRYNRKYGLSRREIQILQGLADGKTSQTIGSELFIAKNTVDVHRRKMLEKTRISNTAGLISYGFRAGLIH